LRGRQLRFLKKINFPSGEANAYGNEGIGNWAKSDYPMALEDLFTALKIDGALNNKTGTAAWLGNIGMVYMYQADYPKALDYYSRALNTFEKLGDKSRMANQLGTWGCLSRESRLSERTELLFQGAEDR